MPTRSDAAAEAMASSVAPFSEGMALLLVGRIADRAFALPASSIERIVGMAAITPLPGLPPGVVGVLNFHGSILPVVDARPALGLPTPEPHPDHRLVVVSHESRYLLWMDRAERIVPVEARCFGAVGAGPHRLTPFVVRLEGEVVPVLSPEALDPGQVVRQTIGGPE